MKMKLNISLTVPCKPAFARTHHLISNCIVSNCLLHGGNLGQPDCYIKTRPRTNKIFKLKINGKSVY